MTRTLFTAAAATLLAGTAFLASFDDAEARGRGDVHRMSNSVRHAGAARGGIARANHGARTNHVARAKNAARANHVSKGQHAGQSTRRGGNVGQVSPRNNHQGPNANQLGNRQGPNANQLGNRQGPNANQLGDRQGPNQQAGGASMKTGNLSPGPRSNNETHGRVFRNEMGPMNNNTNNNTPQANNPQANNNPPPNKGQFNQGDQIKITLKNEFKKNLNPFEIYDVGQKGLPIGTTYSLCVLMLGCAAGAPPHVVEVLAAPLPAITSTGFEAGVKAFTPIDPNDPFSNPVDITTTKSTLNINKAVQQQLGGNLPPAWGDIGK